MGDTEKEIIPVPSVELTMRCRQSQLCPLMEYPHQGEAGNQEEMSDRCKNLNIYLTYLSHAAHTAHLQQSIHTVSASLSE